MAGGRGKLHRQGLHVIENWGFKGYTLEGSGPAFIVRSRILVAGFTMHLSQSEAKKIRLLLLGLKGELQARVDTIHNHARNPLDADSAEQAAQLGNVEVTTALENEAMQEIAEIKAALQRLEIGEYGVCASCGEVIGSERLEARPASSECVDCAELG